MKSSTSVSAFLILGLIVPAAAQAQVAAHGYADVLVHAKVSVAAEAALVPPPAPVSPTLAAATEVSPALSGFKISDRLKLALDAARLDADAKRDLLESQRARGGLDEQQFQQQMADYQQAVQAYDQLATPDADVADEAQAQALATRLLDFNRAGRFRSVLADVGVRRGEDGSVLAERASLEASVTQSVDELRATLPADQDTRPAQAYLDALQNRTINRIRAQGAASDAIPFADATAMVQPVQQTQAVMMSGPAPNWNLKVNLKSSPANAVVVFFTQSGYHRNFLTDASKVVMRGLLEYVVMKPGYKTVKGQDLDLVTAVTGEFTCTLVPANTPDPPLPCQIE